MVLKEKCLNVNEDNYFQEGETLKELTVTITLEEYRNLIIERERLDAHNQELNSKLSELEKQAKLVYDMLIYEHSEFVQGLFETVKEYIAKMQKDGNENSEEKDTV